MKLNNCKYQKERSKRSVREELDGAKDIKYITHLMAISFRTCICWPIMYGRSLSASNHYSSCLVWISRVVIPPDTLVAARIYVEDVHRFTVQKYILNFRSTGQTKQVRCYFQEVSLACNYNGATTYRGKAFT